MNARKNRTAGNIILSESTAADRNAVKERIIVAKYKALARRGAVRLIGNAIAIDNIRHTAGTR